MSAGSKIVKATAKSTLKNNYSVSLFCSTALIIVFFLGTYISYPLTMSLGNVIGSLFMAFFSFFVTAPVFLGVLRFFWRLSFSVTDSPLMIFYYFSKKELYFRTIKFLFNILVKLIPSLILLTLPPFTVFLISKGEVFDFFEITPPLWTANLENIIFLTTTLSVIVFLFVLFKYYLSPLLFIADENIDTAEAIHMSMVISKKTSLDFAYLVLSFIGWILISFLILPLIFLLPYMLSAYCTHTRFAVAEYNKHIENNSFNNIPTFDADF